MQKEPEHDKCAFVLCSAAVRYQKSAAPGMLVEGQAEMLIGRSGLRHFAPRTLRKSKKQPEATFFFSHGANCTSAYQYACVVDYDGGQQYHAGPYCRLQPQTRGRLSFFVIDAFSASIDGFEWWGDPNP